MLTPEKIEALNKVTGLKPATGGSSRGNELRNLARLSKPETTTPEGGTFLGFKQGELSARIGDITREEVGNASQEFSKTFSEAPGVVGKTAAALNLPLRAAWTSAKILGKSVSEPIQKFAEFIGSPIVEKIEAKVPGFSEEVANNVGNITQFIQGKGEEIKSHVGEQTYNDLVATAEVLSTFYGGKAAEPLVKAGVETVETGVELAGKEALALADDVSGIFKPSQQAIDNYIINNFEKGVKPTTVGRNKVLGQTKQYENQAVQAVKTIAENKNNLKFVTEEGEAVVGRLPETVREFAESIEQTKRAVFSKYDSLTKKAGQAGGKVDGEGIVKELDAVVNNEALAVSNPEAINYAKQVQNRLKTFDSKGNFTGYKKFDTETAQDIIKNYNNSLEAFYRNPSYDNASRAAIDAGVVNNFRRDLDNVIENLTGEEYQALKNQYAALKTIEKDVVKRANVLARQNNKSLLDYSDIFTGGQMVTGILSLNPALFAKGAIERGFKEWIKYLNNPNRAIRKMFEQTEVTPRGGTAPKSALGAFVAEPKLGLSVEDVSKIPKNVNPGSVAKKLDEMDVTIIENYLSNPNIKNYEAVDPILKNMRIDKADSATQKKFLKDVLNEYSGTADQEVFGATPRSKPTPIQDLDTGRMNGSKKGEGAIPETTLQTYKGEKDLSTKLLRDLEGRATVSKQYLIDATNRSDLKQAERDLFRRLLEKEGDTINVPAFAKKVKGELLPLKEGNMSSKYESITLPPELRGKVRHYGEFQYDSPIKTSAGDVHFNRGPYSKNENYFAHVRREDLPMEGQPGFATDPEGTTRRVIEIQSDLFQKGRLEGEQYKTNTSNYSGDLDKGIERFKEMRGIKGRELYKEEVDSFKEFLQRDKEELAKQSARAEELAKLEPYRNTWHERVIRDEVKQAAKDGKTKLQFPTGETAMKIEGLGANAENWVSNGGRINNFDQLKVGQEVGRAGEQEAWIITDVLGDGKFKAIQKEKITPNGARLLSEGAEQFDLPGTDSLNISNYAESFDISGKVDTDNPIYKFYEKEVGKYLKNKYNAQLITDPQGVKWWEVKINKEMKKLPVEAFALIGAVGLATN